MCWFLSFFLRWAWQVKFGLADGLFVWSALNVGVLLIAVYFSWGSNMCWFLFAEHELMMVWCICVCIRDSMLVCWLPSYFGRIMFGCWALNNYVIVVVCFVLKNGVLVIPFICQHLNMRWFLFVSLEILMCWLPCVCGYTLVCWLPVVALYYGVSLAISCLVFWCACRLPSYVAATYSSGVLIVHSCIDRQVCMPTVRR